MAMDMAEIAVGRGFETYEEIEEAVKRLENEHYHPFRRFNSQSVKEYNQRWENTGSNLRLAESLKFAFVSYRLVITVFILGFLLDWIRKFSLFVIS